MAKKRVKVPGSGRKKGSRNKRNKKVEAAIAASGLTPLEYMLGVLRNPKKPRAERMQAAVAAAPYVHQRLAATTLTTPPGKPIEGRIILEAEPYSAGEYLEKLAEIAADRAARAPPGSLGDSEVPDGGGREGHVPD